MGTRTCVAGLSQMTRYALDHHASPNRIHQASELSNTVFSHSSNVNSHIMSDAILLCNQNYCIEVYILINIYIYIYFIYIYIYIATAIFCYGTSLKKKHLATCGLEYVCMVCELLIYIYIYIYDVYHASPKKDPSSPWVKQHCLFPFVQC